MNDNTKPMKVAYPITKNAKGEEYRYDSMEDFLRLLYSEPDGKYIVGNNNMWHGGVHLSSRTANWCIPPEHQPVEVNFPHSFPKPHSDEPTQPIRCMATGKIVAFRINDTYQDVVWDVYKTKYSSSFVLIKHEVIPPAQPAPAGENSTPPEDNRAGQLTFYTLYMHLAPWSTYLTGERLYKNRKKSTVRDDPETSHAQGVIEAGTLLRWDPDDPGRSVRRVSPPYTGRIYGLVEIVKFPPEAPASPLNIGDKVWVMVDKDPISKEENMILQDAGITLPPWEKREPA